MLRVGAPDLECRRRHLGSMSALPLLVEVLVEELLLEVRVLDLECRRRHSGTDVGVDEADVDGDVASGNCIRNAAR